MSAERGVGVLLLLWVGGLKQRGEGGGVSGLFKALVLCLSSSPDEEGVAHMHIVATTIATFSQPALRLTAANGQSPHHRVRRSLETREASTEAR